MAQICRVDGLQDNGAASQSELLDRQRSRQAEILDGEIQAHLVMFTYLPSHKRTLLAHSLRVCNAVQSNDTLHVSMAVPYCPSCMVAPATTTTSFHLTHPDC